MTTVALFGATGKTGRRVLDRLLAGGFHVRALVRDPGKIDTSAGGRLTILTGSVLDRDAVDRTIAGSDVVLSLFGHVKDSPPTLQTDGTQLIVDAMKRHGVRRIVSLSGGGLSADGVDQPKAADHIIRFLLRVLSGKILADAEGHLRVLQESGLDWTVVRAPRLLDTPGVGHYRVGWVGVNGSTKISRDDFADFVVTQVHDRTFVGQMPFVSD